MTRFLAVLVVISSTLVQGPAPALTQQVEAEGMIGFSAAGAVAQRELEKQMDSKVQAPNLRAWMERMTARPHNLGAPQTRRNAEMIAELFRQWGYETEIEIFHVLFPTPKVRELQLVEPERYEAGLTEGVVQDDSTSIVAVNEGLPPYNAYSADGDVTAELVYVNQGVPADYEELAREDRHCPLRRVMARHQAQGRSGEGSGGLSDLFGSA